jgi:hypothetical protein
VLVSTINFTESFHKDARTVEIQFFLTTYVQLVVITKVSKFLR